jgi:hypothetical protein
MGAMGVFKTSQLLLEEAAIAGKGVGIHRAKKRKSRNTRMTRSRVSHP